MYLCTHLALKFTHFFKELTQSQEQQAQVIQVFDQVLGQPLLTVRSPVPRLIALEGKPTPPPPPPTVHTITQDTRLSPGSQAGIETGLSGFSG